MIFSLSVVLVAALVLTAPGLAVGAALGLRGWTLLGSAPALTLGVAGLLITVTSALGVPWSPGILLLMLLAVCVLLAAACRPWRRVLAGAPTNWRPAHHLAVGAAVLVGGAWASTVVFRATRRLTAIPQGWDAMFHASAIRHIADVHNANPSILNAVGQPDNPNFYYPDAYHALAAIVYQLLPITPAQAMNAFSVVTPALFCLTIALLARTLTGRPAVTVAAALLATAVTYFPFDMIRFGPLLPFALAIAAVPAVIALLERTLTRASVGLAIALALAVSGLVAVHPSVAVAAVVWCLLHLIVRVGVLRRAALRGLGALAAAALLTVVLMIPVITTLSAAAGNADMIVRPLFLAPGPAIGSALSFNSNNPTPQWTLALVFLIGIGVAVRRSALWSTLGATAVFTALFMLTASYDNPFSRAVTSLWWDDNVRFTALLALPAVLISAVGLVAVRDGILLALRRVSDLHLEARVPAVRPVVFVACILAFWLVSGLGYATLTLSQLRPSFADGPTLSSGEQQALAYLASVNDGTTILNDPYDGSSWGYSLRGLNIMFPSPLPAPVTDANFGSNRLLLLRDFNKIDTMPSVRQAASQLNVGWVMLGEGFVAPDRTREPGLTGLSGVGSLSKVFDNGAAKVYKLIPAAGTPPETAR